MTTDTAAMRAEALAEELSDKARAGTPHSEYWSAFKAEPIIAAAIIDAEHAAYARGWEACRRAAVEILLPLLEEKLYEEWEQGNIGQYEYGDGGDWEWEQTINWVKNTDDEQFDQQLDDAEDTNKWVAAYRFVRGPLTPPPGTPTGA